MENQDNNGNAQPLKTRDDKREHNIDANKSISEMREDAEAKKSDKLADQAGEQDNGPEDDAMNYKSDRDHGTYNPENI
ncbi:hypothetical protein [Pedobacter heparinus]|uniref:hypothetical protein n=1 Tax=Pedobacter heparinus TaxID=984 RepID=UPI00292DD2D0|nr:hypothetical protein [Pedobacter heparinus]